MESSNDKTGSSRPEAGVQKHERLARIFQQLSDAPPANNAQEAHALVDNAFAGIESAATQNPNASPQMTVGAFDRMRDFDFNGRKVVYALYAKHVLFLGDNGAIEILAPEDPPVLSLEQLGAPPFTSARFIFGKPGADGRNPWEPPVH